MNDDNTSERAAALVHQYLDLLRRAEDAPASPVNAFLTAKRRRALRRDAARLRQGKTEPRYKNLHTAEGLAAIYERTAQRDEMFEQSVKDFKRIARELERIREEHPAEVQEAMVALVREAKRAAEEGEPGSEAARRFWNVLCLADLGHQLLARRRRQRTPVPRRINQAPHPSFEAWLEQTAAELLTSPPLPEEAVIAIPPEGHDSGRGRIVLRIGIGPASWIGSFERGHRNVSTVSMLPDDKHLFISAAGAGYILDAETRTLVETTGTEVIGTLRDEPMTLFIVNHNGLSLEAFGRTGRLWKTDTIGSGGFRRMALIGNELVGEARHPAPERWVAFAVHLATGAVEIDARDGSVV